MTECAGCAVLEARLAAAGSRESIRLQEVDRLRDRVESLERAMAAMADAGLRHRSEVVCDRCRTSLVLGTALESSEDLRAEAAAVAAHSLGWHLGQRTRSALGLGPRPGMPLVEMVAQIAGLVESPDLCPACAALVNGGGR